MMVARAARVNRRWRPKSNAVDNRLFLAATDESESEIEQPW
jgi:hypothetical protein